MYNAGIVRVIIPQLLEFCGTEQFVNATKEVPISIARVVGKSTLRLTLFKQESLYILRVLRSRNNLSIEMSQKHRAEVMLASSTLFELDHIELLYLVTLPHRRLSDRRWRETGILLPYGYSTEGFDVMNP